MIWKDPIIEDVRRLRRKYTAALKNNVDAIFDDLKKREQTAGGNFVTLRPRAPRFKIKTA